MSSALATRALLDTTVQIDRLKSPERRERIAEELGRHGWTFSTTISLLEFKATIIQECITIHNEMRRLGARFTRVRDRLLESSHPQAKLRTHVFNNLVSVFPAGTAFETSDEEDARLAERARLSLENIIPELHDWFLNDSAESHLRDRVGCTRAAERPAKPGRVFEVNLPRCVRGRNKDCRVESAIRDAGSRLRNLLSAACDAADAAEAGSGGQLRRALAVIDRTLAEPAIDLSHSDCRSAGDVLIGLEGEGQATHALSTNARDWSRVAALVGMEFVRIVYAT